MEKKGFKKHHFWILLGLAVLLIPITLSGAVFGVGGAADAKHKTIESELKAINSQQVKSDDYREKLETQKIEIQKQKERVWKDAYAAQAGLIHWPAALANLNDLYFGDAVDAPSRAIFMKGDVYGAEYEQLPEVIYPTFFPDYNWRQVLTRYPQFSKLPTTEETWLALEDLCVQREVLRDVDAVNRMLAEFLPDPLPPKKPAEPKGTAAEEKQRYQDEMARYTKAKDAFDEAKRKVDGELNSEFKVQRGEFAGRFISPYWRLDLVASRPAGGRAGELAFRGKLTNTSGRRLTVGRIDFKAWLRNPAQGTGVDYVLLPIETERGYLEAGETFPNKERDGKEFFTVTRTGPSEPALHVYKIEQKLDARFAPVKRVDKLELGYKSQRFAGKELVPSAFSEEEIKKDPAASAAPPVAGPTATPVPGAAGGGGPDFTPNAIPRRRYLERTQQVRRMPVGVVLVVDQAHVQDVLRAFANSRLRFQNTQYHLTRFRDVISLDSPEMSTGAAPPVPGAPVPPQGAPIPPRGVADIVGTMRRGPGGGGKRGIMGGMGEEFRGPGPGSRREGRPPPIPGAGFDPNAGSAEEENNNLVELTVYGLISLYERFPPKEAAAAPGATTPPGAPTGPAPAAPTPPPPTVPNVPIPPTAPTGGSLPPPTPPGPSPTGGVPKPPG